MMEKLKSIVRSSNDQYLELEIVSPKGVMAQIKSHKGINLPDSSIKMPALTQEDLGNLEFVVNNANMVGLSFVQKPEDIDELREK